MTGSIKKAKDLAQLNGWFQPQQFNNPANPKIHRETTAKEIMKQVPQINAFVAGVGTGGTITGVGEVLKKYKTNIKIIAVEPAGSPVIAGGNPGKHKIQGIGAGFIPNVLNAEVIDKIIAVNDKEAIETTKRLAREEGIFAGISAGANVFAALQVANKLGKEKSVVVILPDTGERYLSTTLFESGDGGG